MRRAFCFASNFFGSLLYWPKDRNKPFFNNQILGLIVLLGLLFAETVFARSDANILVSLSSNRSNGVSLAGKTVNGNIYIFVLRPRRTKWRSVEFYLDDPNQTQARFRREYRTPYDFMGGSRYSAVPFESALISNGEHTITAVLKGRRSTEIINATFTVDNQEIGSGLLTSSAQTLSFGDQRVSTMSASQILKSTNSGTAPVNIATVTTTGNFQLDSNGCGTLSIGQSCNVSLNFKPTAVGVHNGMVTVTNDASNSPLEVSLKGTGTMGTLIPSVTSIDFGEQVVGETTSVAETVTLTNSGTAPVNVQNVTVNGDFRWVSNTCGNVAIGESCAISLMFSPTISGTHNNTLKISSGAENDTLAVPLTGAGVISDTRAWDPYLDVILTWDPAPGVVTGYNIYYGDTSNFVDNLLGTIPIISIDPQAPSYQLTVERDSTICFGVKARNDDGFSELSNVVCKN